MIFRLTSRKKVGLGEFVGHFVSGRAILECVECARRGGSCLDVSRGWQGRFVLDCSFLVVPKW